MIKLGLLVPQVNTVGLVAHYKLWAGLTVSSPASANLVTNGDLTAWGGVNDVSELPTGWTRLNDDTVNRHLRQVGAGQFDGGAGTGAANIWTDNGDSILLRQTAILTVGKTYRMTVDFWDNGGGLTFRNFANAVTYAILDGTGFKVVYFVAADTGITFVRRAAEATDCTIDNVEIVEWPGKLFDYSLGEKPGTPLGTDIGPTYPGFSFNGTDGFIDVGNQGGAIKSIAIWINVTSIAGFNYVIDLNGTDYISINADSVGGSGFAGSTFYVDGIAANTITAATWHLIGLTISTAKTASDLDIGRVEGQGLFTGKIGDTMLFDRELSAPDMKSIYSVTRWRYGV